MGKGRERNLSVRGRKQCEECGSYDEETDQEGVTYCPDCGYVKEEDNLDRTVAPSRKTSDPEKSRDTYVQRTILSASKDLEPDDLIRIIPKPEVIKSKQEKKREEQISIQEEWDKVEQQKRDLEGEIDEISAEIERAEEEEDQEKIDECLGRKEKILDEIFEIELEEEEIRKRSMILSKKEAKVFGQNSTKEKIELMRANRSARDWLSLTKNQDETAPNPESILIELKELGPKVDRWASSWESNVYKNGFLTDLIWGNCVPQRSLMDLDGRKYRSNSRERIGLEAFIGLEGKGKLLWFFDDFGKRTRLNAGLVSAILSNDIPISRTAREDILRMGLRSWEDTESIRNFFLLCAKICGTNTGGAEMTSLSEIPIPPEDIWAKLGIGPIGEGRTLTPRYWVEKQGMVPAELVPDGSGMPPYERWGFVRKHPKPIILRHIPLAYFIAQEFWNRRTPEYRPAISRLRKLIRRDLEWCEATVEELNTWWEKHWATQTDETKPFTKMI